MVPRRITSQKSLKPFTLKVWRLIKHLACEKDVTEQVTAGAEAEEEELLLREQELSNYLQQKNYVKAVGVAITLDQPFRVFTIFQELLEKCSQGGEFCSTIRSLREDQVYSLVRYASRWNQNARRSYVAQSVLWVVLRTYPPDKLMEMEDLHKVLEGLIPYTERHMQRLLRLQQLSKFVDYTVQAVKLPTLQGTSTCKHAITASTVDEDHALSQPARMEVDPDSTTADSTTNLHEDPMQDKPDQETEEHVTSTTGSGDEEITIIKKPRRLKRKLYLKEVMAKTIKMKSKIKHSRSSEEQSVIN